jgi:aryl-alcohol dehydrogenase-like predicted oxidoreductase
MRQAVEASLKRLGTDYIDLYYLHMWDYTTPVEEVMRAFDDLVRAGKVLYVGISDTPAWVAAQANTLADLRGWSRLVALQAPYSLADRSVERDLLPMTRACDIAFLPWGLLEAGELTGKYNRPTSEPKRNQSADERNMALAEAVMQVASEIGRTPSQVAINWVRQQPGAHSAPVIPILGARTEAHIKDNLGCLDFELTSEQRQRLAQASPINLGFPHSFFASEDVKKLIFGDTYPLIDNHRS